MTGGQYSPLTPTGSKATTAPYATIEQDFNVAELVKAAGATFVARGTTFHAQILADLIAKGAVRDNAPVKVLGDGETTVAFTLKGVKASASAKSKIEAAGGSVSED